MNRIAEAILGTDFPKREEVQIDPRFHVPCEGCTCGLVEHHAKYPDIWRCGTIEATMCTRRG